MSTFITDTMPNDLVGDLIGVVKHQGCCHIGASHHKLQPLTDARIAAVFRKTGLEERANLPTLEASTKTSRTRPSKRNFNAVSHSRFFEWALRRFD